MFGRVFLICATLALSAALQAHAQDYYSPFSYSGWAGSDSEPIVSLSLDPKENTNNGFRLAAREDRLDQLQSFLREGADINSVADDGQTALMIASRNCSPKLVGYLLTKGADVNVQDRQGRTALMLAAGGDCLPIVIALTAVPGVKIKIRDHQWRTAYDYAGRGFQIVDALSAVDKRKPRRR